MPLLCEAFAPEANAMDSAARAVIGASENTLLAALQPQVGLAVWLRQEPPGFVRSLRVMREGGPFRATGAGTPEAALDELCEQLPEAAPAEFLTDIFRLSTLFGVLTRSETVRLRLEGVTGDACRKFHVDAVGFRLLVTYTGPGTQWVMGDPEVAAGIEQVPRCAVALLRGRGRPGGACDAPLAAPLPPARGAALAPRPLHRRTGAVRMNPTPAPLAVTVLSGFLGAGKTTLLTKAEWSAGPRSHARLPDPFPPWEA